MRRAITNGLGALILALGAITAAHAQEAAIADPMKITRVFAPSSGWLHCDHWLSARSQNAEEARRLEAWALGYASAYAVRLENRQAMDLGLSNQDLFSKIDARCRALSGGVGAAVGGILDEQAAP